MPSFLKEGWKNPQKSAIKISIRCFEIIPSSIRKTDQQQNLIHLSKNITTNSLACTLGLKVLQSQIHYNGCAR